jgi:hypothetical protein
MSDNEHGKVTFSTRENKPSWGFLVFNNTSYSIPANSPIAISDAQTYDGTIYVVPASYYDDQEIGFSAGVIEPNTYGQCVCGDGAYSDVIVNAPFAAGDMISLAEGIESEYSTTAIYSLARAGKHCGVVCESNSGSGPVETRAWMVGWRF